MSETIEITAKKRSRCKCGSWVRPGQKILWNKNTRKTEECGWCRAGVTKGQEEDLEVWSDLYDDIHYF